MRIKSEDFSPSLKVILRNEEKPFKDGQEPCYLCSSPTLPTHRVHVVGYGCEITDEEEEQEDSIGWHVVGPSCFRKIKKAFGGKYPEFQEPESMGETGSHPTPTVPRPSIDELQEAVIDGAVPATDGCLVEPDGSCPHGYPSWLIELGLI